MSGTERPRLNEIVVVEGLHDKQVVQNAVIADIWVLGGDRISHRTVEELKRAQATRGVIVLTDPDGPGERIRRRLSQAIPGCRHAFVPKQEAKGNGGVGVEHARVSVVQTALLQARAEHPVPMGESDGHATFSIADLQGCGMAGTPEAAALRERVGERLGIGYANAKSFVWKLNALGITREEWNAAVHDIRGGEET